MKALRFAGTLLILSAALASAQVFIHSESLNGDLSDSHVAPTPLALPLGTSFVEFSVGEFDTDLFSLHIPMGLRLDAVILRSYTSTANNVSFLGFQENRLTLSSPPSSIFPDPINFSLFGQLALNDDLLPAMVLNNASLSASLPQGDYAFWINETRNTANVVLELQSSLAPIPEPSIGLYLILGMSALLTRRSRTRSNNSDSRKPLTPVDYGV